MNHTQSQASNGNRTKINPNVIRVERLLSGHRPMIQVLLLATKPGHFTTPGFAEFY
jgi:hypothetical protein